MSYHSPDCAVRYSAVTMILLAGIVLVIDAETGVGTWEIISTLVEIVE